MPRQPTAAEAAAAIFGAGPSLSDPCRDGTHDCWFRGCACPGHTRAYRLGAGPSTRCGLALAPEGTESCPRCGAVSWGQTEGGRAECTRCQWAAR